MVSPSSLRARNCRCVTICSLRQLVGPRVLLAFVVPWWASAVSGACDNRASYVLILALSVSFNISDLLLKCSLGEFDNGIRNYLG